MKPAINQNKGWEVVPAPLKAYSPEWFIFNYMEAWIEKDLDVAIINDIRPDLSNFSELILDQTTDFFLNLFKIHRPDLSKRMQSKDGRQWLRRIIKSATTFK